MMSILSLLSTGSAEAFAVAVDVALKGTLLLAAAIATHAMLGDRRPLVRSGVWNACLLGLLLLPVATSAFPRLRINCLPREEAPPMIEAVRSSPRQVEPPRKSRATDGPSTLADARPGAIPAEAPRLPTSEPSIDEARPPRIAKSPTPVVLTRFDWIRLLIRGYGLVVVLLLIRLLLSLAAVGRLKRSAAPVTEPRWVESLERWRRQLEIGRPVALFASGRLGVPVVVGWRRPAIVLPFSLLADDGAKHRDAVLLHELAHVRRGDYPWNLVLRLAQVVYWPHPFMRLAGRLIGDVRERACDDLCVHWGNPRDYRETLLDVAAGLVGRPGAALGMAMARPTRLGRRLAQIDRSRGDSRCLLRGPARATIALFVIAAVGLLGSAQLSRPTEASRKPKPEGPANPSPFTFKADDIPASERFPWQPSNLIAVLGEHRGRHWGEVECMALTPNGKLIASGGEDKVVRLWDANTLRQVGVLFGHRSRIQCLAISPDGKTLVAGGSYGDLLKWDIGGAEPGPPSVILKSFHTLNSIAFAPDGKSMAVSGSSVTFHGDGRKILPDDLDEVVKRWDMTGAEPKLLPALKSSIGEVRSLVYSPDGKTLALTGLDDGTIRLWDMAGAEPRERASLKGTPPVPGGRAYIDSVTVAFSPDGRTLASIEDGQSVRLWDLGGERPTEQALLPVKMDGGIVRRPVQMVAFSPDGKTLAAGDPNGSFHLWDVSEVFLKVRATIPAHTWRVNALLFTAEGRTLISAGGDHTIRLWDATQPVPTEKVAPKGVVGGFRDVAFAADGKSLVTGGDDEFVRLWDLSGGKPAMRSAFRLPFHKLGVAPYNHMRAVALSPDGKTLACANSDHTIRLWSLDGDEPVQRTVIEGHADSLNQLAFTPDGKALISSGDDHTVRLWNLDGDVPRETASLGANDQWPPSFGLSPDGKTLAFDGTEGTVRVYKLDGPMPRHVGSFKLRAGWGGTSYAYSPDGKTLALGENSGFQLFDLTDDAPRLKQSIKGSFANSLAFTRDGKTIVAATGISNGGEPLQTPRSGIRQFDVVSGEILHEWELPSMPWATAMSPVGGVLAAANRNGTVYLLRIRESLKPGRPDDRKLPGTGP